MSALIDVFAARARFLIRVVIQNEPRIHATHPQNVVTVGFGVKVILYT